MKLTLKADALVSLILSMLEGQLDPVVSSLAHFHEVA